MLSADFCIKQHCSSIRILDKNCQTVRYATSDKWLYNDYIMQTMTLNAFKFQNWSSFVLCPTFNP